MNPNNNHLVFILICYSLITNSLHNFKNNKFSLFLLNHVGFIVIIFSVEWNDWLSSLLPYAPQPVWLDKTTWIFFFVGITTVAYGIKRIIQDVIL